MGGALARRARARKAAPCGPGAGRRILAAVREARMRVEMTESGPVVAAEDLGPALGVAPAEVPRLLREGRITALHERGEGEDAGRFRLTFRYGARRLRLTCDAEGRVISRIAHGPKRDSSGPGGSKPGGAKAP